MNFPTHMDQLIHDHLGALHADAGAQRLARRARAGRRAARRARRQAAASVVPAVVVPAAVVPAAVVPAEAVDRSRARSRQPLPPAQPVGLTGC